MLRIGSLCSGYGGLDLAVEEVFQARTVWHAEVDAHASKVLKARWEVPNHGDLTVVDWAAVEPIDIMTAGWPCQPWSLAGKQKGAEDERAIWPEIARAVRALRPRYVVLENVPAVVVLGELARAVGDLASARYDAQWTCLSAGSVGAPHRRERMFIVANPDESGPQGAQPAPGRYVLDGRASANPKSNGWNKGGAESTGLLGRSDAAIGSGEHVDLLPTPTQGDGQGGGKRHGVTWEDTTRSTGEGGASRLRDVVMLLPTPRTADAHGAGAHGAGAHGAGAHGAGGPDLRTTVTTLLPTPTAGQGRNETAGRQPDSQHHTGTTPNDVAYSGQWGKYGAAIERWERLTHPAPSPTEPNAKGDARLSARFAEWMMGLPAGWVTDVDLPRSAHLKILGNGVVPAQAKAALLSLLQVVEVA